MSSSQAILADQKKHHHHNSGGNNNNNNNTNKPTNDLAQIEKIKRIVEREILDNGRHLFPHGRWPSDGVGDPNKHPEPYSAAMKFGGRDPINKKRPGLTKRPPNMWMIFRMHAASVVMEDFPEVNQAALTSVLAPIWQSVITAEEKDLVRVESERLKEFHKLEFPEWKYRPRQKKRTSSSQQQQACDAAPAKRECQQYSSGGAARYPQQQQQHQPQFQHLMQEAVSPYLSSGSPDLDHIDGLRLPLSVDTSPQAASAAPASDSSAAAAAAAAAAACLPFPSPWSQAQVIPVSLANYAAPSAPPSSSGYVAAAAVCLQSPTSHAEQHQQSTLKDPTLRSILAASAPSSMSSSSGGVGISGLELSCLPDLLPADYFNDFPLPDLEAYLSPEGCSGGPMAEPPAPLPSLTPQQQLQCDFQDSADLRHIGGGVSVKQEFSSYAVI